jgi:hypothetical protein
MLVERRQNVVDHGHVFLLVDVHAAMRVRHATAAVLLRATAARPEEIARVLFHLGKRVGLLAVGQEVRVDQRIVHVRFDDIVHQGRNACGAAETVRTGCRSCFPPLLCQLFAKGARQSRR